jgi:hypothetical protein
MCVVTQGAEVVTPIGDLCCVGFLNRIGVVAGVSD